MVFSPTYILFEIPWVVAVPYFGIHRVLAVAGLGWGVVTLGTGFIHNYGQAIATRVLLGIFEAALVPCLVFIISLIWPRESQAKRVGFIYIASSISGGFGGLIAYAIQISGTRHGLAPWRWLFIVEGVVSTGLAIICWIALPKSAEDAWFLTEREKSAMMAKKQREIVYKGEALFTWANFKAACLEPLVWLAGVTLFSNSCAVTGYAVFLPTILAGMGYTSVQANYLTIPIYAFTGIMVSPLPTPPTGSSVAVSSSPCFRSSPSLVIPLLSALPTERPVILACIYAQPVRTKQHVSTASPKIGCRLMAIELLALLLRFSPCNFLHDGALTEFLGLISFTCIFLTWLSNNIAPDSKRSVALPTLVSIANLSGICSPYIYQRDDAPRFVRGNSISLSFAVVVVILVVSMYFLLLKRNKEKKRLLSEGVTDNGLTGDRALNFEYKL